MSPGCREPEAGLPLGIRATGSALAAFASTVPKSGRIEVDRSVWVRDPDLQPDLFYVIRVLQHVTTSICKNTVYRERSHIYCTVYRERSDSAWVSTHHVLASGDDEVHLDILQVS